MNCKDKKRMWTSFPYYRQQDQMDCGPTCLRMIARHYGRNFKMQTLRNLCQISKEGVSLLEISNASEKIGFRSLGVKINTTQLKETDLPCILHWRQSHFVVLYKIKSQRYYLADPGSGLVIFDEADFIYSWEADRETNKGVALLLSPTSQFYKQESDDRDEIKWAFIFKYLKTYRNLFIQLLFGFGLGGILQLVTPFLTQSIVDIGINSNNLDFIYMVLFAQIALVVGRLSVDFIRSWILLHISIRLNVSILTDFLIKLMKLPLSFFDTKLTGDIIQRMNDQKTIQTFITGSVLNTAFSMFNLVMFSVVMASYNITIFSVFVIFSAGYIGWIALFLGRRRMLNYNNFDISSRNQSNIIQLISGMQEIKLNNSEQQKRLEWEDIQVRLFRFNIKILALNQYQSGGAAFINEGKNILITFLSAKSVINGSLSLGEMVAIQYIVGQLSSPIDQLLSFIQGFQDAKISLERLNEIHQLEDEEPTSKTWRSLAPKNKAISICNLSFGYPGAESELVLENINLNIPEGKTTAIVGMSGSGKTTILKLLLRFYKPQKGEIRIGDQPLDSIGFKAWRNQCGVVMQEGFIFSDSIERNIAVGDEYPNKNRLRQAIEVANIQDFIDALPFGLNTKIGAEGNGISQGQRQRLLIARAVYKNPHYIFFDEATNSLDSNNEQTIMNNLDEFFQERTVVIVAHRLSTVRNADNIIVMDQGKIIEQGTHQCLIALKGKYFQLVENQLEIAGVAKQENR